MTRFFCGVVCVLVLTLFFHGQTVYAQSTDYAIEFNGSGYGDIDRIKIPIQSAVNVGATDFTIEWWMRALGADAGTAVCTQALDSWINGRVLIDRDIYGPGEYGDFGISLMSGKIAFGVSVGGNGTTLCGTSNVADGVWHHIAVSRSVATGQLTLYVDGVLQKSVTGPVGNSSYRVGRTTSYPNSDPYLVLGAEKHDAGSAYPSYKGMLNELRISSSVRYSAAFTPQQRLTVDAQTLALFHFDEGSGTRVVDVSPNGISGTLQIGGTRPGPNFVRVDASATATPQQTAAPSTTPQPTTAPGECRADINADGTINLSDYLLLTASFLKVPPLHPRADINADSVVNLSDYAILVRNFLRRTAGCPTITPAPTVTPQPSASATPVPTTPGISTTEWTQHGYNAQKTSYSPTELGSNWTWKWSFNGPSASGQPVSSKFSMPRNMQPVTGDGKVYLGAGSRGVYALAESDANGDLQADVVWNTTTVGTVNSTVAYDPATKSVLVLSTAGTLYKLSAATGTVTGSVALGAGSTLPLPPTIVGSVALVGSSGAGYAVDIPTMTVKWTYQTGSIVQTPFAYSASTDTAIIGTADLYVHAVRLSTGSRVWRVKPSPVTATSPYEFSYGWPVVSDENGLVLIKMRLDWQTMWDFAPYPTTNAQLRSILSANPRLQALFALRLSDGSVPFVTNVGHGGYGDGGYMPMGPQPVIKKLPDGNEVAYTIIRGDNRSDGRWDSHYGELVLDTSVSGYSPGDVRWIQYGNFGWSTLGNNDTPPTDEQPNVSMAGNVLFAGHWAVGYALRVNDRSANFGTYQSPLRSSAVPHIVSSTSVVPYNNATHYSSSPIAMTAGGTEYRQVPYGFYIYNDSVGKIYDNYWRGYASFVPSKSNLYFLSNDGALVALSTTGQSAAAPAPAAVAGAYDEVRSEPMVTKTFRIAYAFNNGKELLLGSTFPHQGSLKVLIKKENWKSLGIEEKIGRNTAIPFPEGKSITVTGTLQKYQGDAVIFVTSADQLR